MNRPRRRGIVLVLVLVVVALLTLASLSFCDLMIGQRMSAQTSCRQAQARALAASGAELARRFLDREAQEQIDAGGIYDNPQRMSNVLVADDPVPRDRGRFTILAPRIDDRTIVGARYGLQDESARLNLGTLLLWEKSSKGSAKAALMALPGMTDQISDAILDWIDADDTPREQGAEAEYYAALSPPYAPRNGVPASIEELLLVRGVTPELLFGADAAAMGLVPASADGSIEGVDNSDGTMEHGWAAYLTLYGAESKTKSDGSARIDLNQSDLKKLYESLTTALDEQSARFIVAYRQNGPASRGGSDAEDRPPSNPQLDFSKKGGTTLGTVLDLIGAQTTVQYVGQKKSTRLKSPFTEDTATMSAYLPKLMENTTCGTETTVRGRININQAPRTVLMCIPGMTADIADQIIAKRISDPTLDTSDRKYETWLLCEGVVPLKTMKKILPFVTTGGCVYRAQILGTFDEGGPAARLEIVLDAGKKPTKLLSWKDMSRLPHGFPAEKFRLDGTTSP